MFGTNEKIYLVHNRIFNIIEMSVYYKFNGIIRMLLKNLDKVILK